ncbi:MAG: gliding motility-associated C-terminal domain-containing protein [Chitinophagaceae bacterium]|nr:gliding motility-associated C-terminal domain-containing protein [Chitinophagaceae bacterium]
MKVIFSIWFLVLGGVIVLPAHGFAQAAAKDTIHYTSTCAGATITFGSPVFDSIFFPSSVKWHFGDPASGYYDSSTAKEPKHVYAAPGSYNVTLTVKNGTDIIQIQKTVKIVPPMAYNFGPDIFLCSGKDTVLTAPAVAGATYLWNDDSATTTSTLKVSKTGVYTVSIDGCGVSDSLGVFFSDTPRLDLGKDHVMCDSANLLLNAASQNGQYTWSLNGTVLPVTEGQLLTHYPGGNYAVVVDVPGCGIYRDAVSITYASPLKPPFSLGPDTLLCPKEVYTLTASLSGATGYDWSTGSSASSIRISGPGTYWVFVTYNGGCQVTDTVLVRYRGDRPLDFHDTAICKGSTLSLNADFGVGQYNWEAIPPQRDDQNQTGQATYFVYRPGTYAVTATVGQCVYKDTLTVRIDDSLKVSMIKDTTLCNGEDFWLQVNGNADSLIWQDGAVSASYKVEQSGIYTVVAKNGCGKDTLRATVNLTACACQLLLPNAFTPDGNGRNDIFRPLHACEMKDFQMAIYDRFGELVFRSSSPGVGWDGTFGGHKVPSGSFIWMVHYFNTITKQPVLRKGTVLVIR